MAPPPVISSKERILKMDQEYCPTPSEIRESCRLLRMEWSEKEEMKRRVRGHMVNYSVTVVDSEFVPAEITLMEEKFV